MPASQRCFFLHRWQRYRPDRHYSRPQVCADARRTPGTTLMEIRNRTTLCSVIFFSFFPRRTNMDRSPRRDAHRNKVAAYYPSLGACVLAGPRCRAAGARRQTPLPAARAPGGAIGNKHEVLGEECTRPGCIRPTCVGKSELVEEHVNDCSQRLGSITIPRHTFLLVRRFQER